MTDDYWFGQFYFTVESCARKKEFVIYGISKAKIPIEEIRRTILREWNKLSYRCAEHLGYGLIDDCVKITSCPDALIYQKTQFPIDIVMNGDQTVAFCHSDDLPLDPKTGMPTREFVNAVAFRL